MSRIERVISCRQVFVVFTILIQSMCAGAMLAFPAILNPAILDPDSADIRATSGEASWIASILGYSGLAGFFILPLAMQAYGRKVYHILINLLSAVGWILLYFAQNLSILYTARAIQGLTTTGIPVNVILIGEYTDPRRRGYFTALQKASLSFGTLFCHAMALCSTWRIVALTAFVASILSALLTMLWPESPFFLATKGRYEECERSFHWLNGKLARNKELKDLICTQKERIESRKAERMSLRRLWELGTTREFVRASLIVTILSSVIDLSGRNFFKAYIIQIMTDLTGNKTTGVYISLLADCLVIVALVMSSIAIKILKRRTLLFSGGALTVLTLYMICLVQFLRNSHGVGIPSWVGPCLILFENFVFNFAVTPVAFAVMGEIFPLDAKGLGSCVSGVALTTTFSTVLKLTPVLMESIGIEGAFVIYSSSLIVCFIILYLILPETKDKTLLEIERNLKGKTEMVIEKESVLLNSKIHDS